MKPSISHPDTLSGKRIQITGGGIGLSKELARQVTAQGASVRIRGRREAAAAGGRRRTGVNVMARPRADPAAPDGEANRKEFAPQLQYWRAAIQGSVSDHAVNR